MENGCYQYKSVSCYPPLFSLWSAASYQDRGLLCRKNHMIFWPLAMRSLMYSANVDDDFLQQNAIEKGGMNLVDAAASQSLLAAISAVAPPQLISGGSAANTAVGLAATWRQGGVCWSRS